jgi:tRNA (guanine37-N1)-methyltransferase
MTKVLFKSTIFTLFPEIYPGPLIHSVTGKAIEEGKVKLLPVDIRDYAKDKRKTVDDTIYGRGDGMLLKPDVLGEAIDANYKDGPLIYLSPRGKPLKQLRVRELSKEKQISLIGGRYEGIDQRVIDYYNIEEISIGDYVTSNGDIPCLILLDAIIRLLPGVVGKEGSTENESFEQGLLEYPHYTRPDKWRGLKVPEVLKSGDHQAVDKWRDEQSLKITKKIRPDLLDDDS